MAEITIIDGRHTYRIQAIGRVFGWFFLATFLTSIPAYFIGYARMLENPDLITGAGADVGGSTHLRGADAPRHRAVLEDD